MKPHPDQHFGCKTYSQHFEDGMLLNIFTMLNISKPSYLDIGAHHPFDISNTALLYERGSRGVNVEANPYLMEAFHSNRPEDKNINLGVDIIEGQAPLYMYSNTSGRNTFSVKEVASLEGVLEVQTQIEIEMVTIDQIISLFCGGIYPDLLSIDIEGLDYGVLYCADFTKSHPSVIIVEVRRHETEKFKNMLYEKYFHLYCRMGENLIFVHENDIDKVY